MDITAFIRELLFGHDCVIVPGFGGFIGNYTPARLDKTTNTFYPPVKQISFNRNLNHNDGLLIGRISESVKLNYGDVRNMVEEFVNDLHRKLSHGEKVVFENIGSFINNQEGNVQFEPNRDANYHLNSFGLTQLQVEPLERHDARKRILKYNDKESARQTSVRKIIWRAAVITVLLTALVAVPLTTDIFKPKVQTTNLNPLATVEFENNKEAVDKTKINDSLLNPGRTAPVIPEKEKSVAKGSENIYCLIAGSFKYRENAAYMMKKLAGEGYKPELINGPNGFYRVSAVRCYRLDEAVKTVDSVGKKYPGTWVIRIK